VCHALPPNVGLRPSLTAAARGVTGPGKVGVRRKIGGWLGIVLIVLLAIFVMIPFIILWVVGFFGGIFFEIVSPFLLSMHDRAYYELVIFGYLFPGIITIIIAFISIVTPFWFITLIIQRLKALRVVRREIIEGSYSYNALVPLLKNANLQSTLDCFFKTAPRAHHELS
jgi:hypothetical protein